MSKKIYLALFLMAVSLNILAVKSVIISRELRELKQRLEPILSTQSTEFYYDSFKTFQRGSLELKPASELGFLENRSVNENERDKAVHQASLEGLQPKHLE